MVALCFKLWVSINFEMFPTVGSASNKEEFGDFASRWEVKI